jgi:hypothetical protein
MKHIRKFESYRISKRREEIIKESVLQVNDIYKVRTMVDIPQSLVNAYVKKVKDNTGKNLRQFFGDVDIAEEIVKHVTLNYINVDQVPAGALTGDAQGSTDGQTQAPVQGQTQAGQAQAPVQGQGQAQVQTQGQAQAPVQGQVQVQTEPAQSQGEFEEVEDEDEEKEGEEELPL